MFVAAFVAVMWVVEIVDLVAGDLDSAGIRPREVGRAWSASRSRRCCTAASATSLATRCRSWCSGRRSR